MNGTLDFFYYSLFDANRYVDYHKHDCFELVYFFQGQGIMNLNGEPLRFVPNSLTMTRPNYMHDTKFDETSNVIFFGFHFDDFPVYLPNGLFLDTDRAEILGLILHMKEEILAQRPHYAIRSNLLLNEIILLLGRQMEGAPSVHRPEKLFYARRFIDENYKQPINLHTLAEISGYSDDHFRHLFKEQTGLSPVNYILHKRLEAAKRQLLHSTASISTIGMDCGFSTTSQFIEMFKRTFGKTPLQYRLKGGER